jgi:hypothetical protein
MKIPSLLIALFVSTACLPAQTYTPTPVPTTTAQLQQTVAWLYQQVVNLQGTYSNLQGQCTTVENTIKALQANPVLALGPYTTFNAGKAQNNSVVVFTGVDIRATKGTLTNN